MAKQLAIRDFSPGNQAATRGLILNGLGEHFGWIDESANPDLDDIALSYGDGRFVCAWLGEELVGTGALVPEAPGVARIVRMSVSQARRRQGIGSAILMHLLELARGANCHQVVVETTETWGEVIAFYQRNGFEEVDRRDGEAHLVIELGSCER